MEKLMTSYTVNLPCVVPQISDIYDIPKYVNCTITNVLDDPSGVYTADFTFSSYNDLIAYIRPTCHNEKVLQQFIDEIVIND
jgi:hypothetical protein